MIDQELYIQILELFDELKSMDVFKKYIEYKDIALADSEVSKLIKEINDLSDSSHNITYQPSLDEIMEKIEELSVRLNNNTNYSNYITSYNECNDYILYISSLIFKDIVEVEREWYCAD